MRQITLKFIKGGEIRVAVPGWDKSQGVPQEIMDLQRLQKQRAQQVPNDVLERAMKHLRGLTFERNGYLCMLTDDRGNTVRFTMEGENVRIDDKTLYNFRNRLLYSGKDLAAEILMAVNAEIARAVLEQIGYIVQARPSTAGDVIEVQAHKGEP